MVKGEVGRLGQELASDKHITWLSSDMHVHTFNDGLKKFFLLCGPLGSVNFFAYS